MIELTRCGIEFEYMLVDSNGEVCDFTNLNFQKLQNSLQVKNLGINDVDLVSGDLGIKRGYWYLEGDERFDENGNFIDCKVKGVEIRTPLKANFYETVSKLLDIERDLSECLSVNNLRLGIVSFNPKNKKYKFEPPLNKWERKMRSSHKEYDFAEISNLTYGPDINLSFENISNEHVLDLTRKLTFYSPFIVPFSFSSPFYGEKLWKGFSKRTYERTWRRPAARCFIKMNYQSSPQMVYQPRIKAEQGRIEFKAYDSFTNNELLLAGAFLVLGVCLDETLDGRSDQPDKALHQEAAKSAFHSNFIEQESRKVLMAARRALSDYDTRALKTLKTFEDLLDQKKSPADKLIREYHELGIMYKQGGLGHV